MNDNIDKKNKIAEDVKNDEKLFESRGDCIKLLEKNIEEDDTVAGIGIVGKYGYGKSFFIDYYKKKHSEYNYIYISSLSANLDNVEKYILQQLKNTLTDNGIYVPLFDDLILYFDRIKFLSYFDKEKSYADLIIDIRKKIQLLNEKIIFIVDDLDRVVDINVIIKIFNIFELLTMKCDATLENKLKVLYLYDIKILKNKFNNDIQGDEDDGPYTLTYNYIRKYIDREIFLPKVKNYNELYELDSSCDLVEEIGIINNRLRKDYKEYNKFNVEFFDYCEFNPRLLNMIISQYEVLKGRYTEESKSLLLDCLIFKYYFEKMYFEFKNDNDDIYQYLHKKDMMKSNNNKKENDEKADKNVNNAVEVGLPHYSTIDYINDFYINGYRGYKYLWFDDKIAFVYLMLNPFKDITMCRHQSQITSFENYEEKIQDNIQFISETIRKI